jgi:PKD repeat protein
VEALPLDVSVEVSPASPNAGETVHFLVNAQGGALFGVAIDFGDATNDQFNTGGARTVRVTFSHAYVDPGTYDVVVTISDASAGSKTKTLSVVVR